MASREVRETKGEDLVLEVFRELCAVRGTIDDSYDQGLTETLH